MKKIMYSLFLLAAAALLLASCSTRLSTVSITKRHYSNGYYIDMVNAKHKTEAISEKTKIPVSETDPVTQAESANNVSETTPLKITTVAGTIAAPKNEQDISKELTASTLKHFALGNLKHIITPNTLKELKNIQAISKSIVLESKDNNSNNGLIWTIIVILLILWLISYLTGGWGFGGLLNLLLVIALVLIILKLLGII